MWFLKNLTLCRQRKVCHMSLTSLPLPSAFTALLDPVVRDTFQYWRYFQELNSTQQYLIDNPLPVPSFCFSNQQKNAQGTHLRDWSATHLGLYFSFTWPKIPGIDARALTLALTLLLIKHLKTHYRTTTQLKWPNDIFFQQKKLAGIRVDEENNHFIVGIGLNLENPDNQPNAIGLWCDQPEKQKVAQPAALIANLINDLAPNLKTLTPEQLKIDLSQLPAEQDYLKNQKVVMAQHPNIFEGICQGIQPDGTLKLVVPNENKPLYFSSGHILSYDA